VNAPRPNTTREALIAEILGELDGLLARVEALPDKVASAELKLTATVAALADASDKYRLAVTAFNEEAKQELAEYLERKAGQIAAKTVEEQRAAIQEAARLAFRSEASDKAASLGVALGQAAKEIRQARGTRLLEHALTALVTSIFTSGMVYGIFKYH
jgi:hypothetical protein